MRRFVAVLLLAGTAALAQNVNGSGVYPGVPWTDNGVTLSTTRGITSAISVPYFPIFRTGDNSVGAGSLGFYAQNPFATKVNRVRLRVGAASAANLSMGIYDSGRNLLVSTGTVNNPNGAAAMEIGVPPTTIPRGMVEVFLAASASISIGGNSSGGDVIGGEVVSSVTPPLTNPITKGVPNPVALGVTFFPADTTPLISSYSRTLGDASVGGSTGSKLYALSFSTGHWLTSTDGITWADQTYSPISALPTGIGTSLVQNVIFQGANMFAYTTNGKIFKATTDTFNNWTEISIPAGSALGQLPAGTTGRADELVSNGTYLFYGNYNTDAGAHFTGTPAVVTAAVGGGVITGYTVVSGGTGYTAAAVTVNAAGCSVQPTATATIAGGAIASLAVVASGTSGCTAATVALQDSSAANVGGHIYRSADSGATWVEVLTLPDARHIHAIGVDPANAAHIWATAGDTNYGGLGLYYSGSSGAAGSWGRLAGNRYGINMAFPPTVTGVPPRVLLEGDGASQPPIDQYYQANTAAATLLDPLVWGDASPDDGRGSWVGTTTRGILYTSAANLFWITTTEGGAAGTRAGVWAARGPWFTTPVLLEETTGNEWFYNKTFELNGLLFNGRYSIPTPKFAGQ